MCVCACASRVFFCFFCALIARPCASLSARVCVRMCVRCAFYGGACAGFVSLSLRVRARAYVCARGDSLWFCRSFGKHLRACVACACAARLRVCASALCGRWGGTAATGGINSSAGGAARPRVRGCGSVRSALGVARVRPQVRRGRAARPARNGLRAMGTRRWSTPPAPSTSSAAATSTAPAPPSTRTCG